jgi:hypothetical protein
MTKWEYVVVPLAEASALKKRAEGLASEPLNELGGQGWEAVGLTLKKGDLVAWPIVLLKRPVEEANANVVEPRNGLRQEEGLT